MSVDKGNSYLSPGAAVILVAVGGVARGTDCGAALLAVMVVVVVVEDVRIGTVQVLASRLVAYQVLL